MLTIPRAVPTRRRHIEVLLFSAVALVAAPLLEVRSGEFVGLRGVPRVNLPPSCASQALFGVDCPGCGLTRSFVHLACGDVAESLRCHRIGWLLMALAAVQIPYRLLALRRPDRPPLSSAVCRWIGYAVIAALVGNWVIGLIS